MIHQETLFVGIDTYTAATRLSAGYLQQADNVLIEGGDVVTRPGVVGLLAAAMGHPIYEITAYRQLAPPVGDGHEHLIFVCNGKLWQWDTMAGSASPTQIYNGGGTTSFAFANGGMNVRFARYGKFLYGCDGVGPLFRVNLEAGTCASYAAMIAPQAPTVTLNDTTIDYGTTFAEILAGARNPNSWSGYPAPSNTGSLVLNGSFESGIITPSTGTNYPIGSWMDASTSGNHTDARNSNDNAIAPVDGAFALLLDTSLASTYQDIMSLPTENLMSFDLGTPTARVYTFQCTTHNADSSGKSSAVVRVQAYDASGTLMAEIDQEIVTAYSSVGPSEWTPYEFSVSFAELATDPVSLRVYLNSGATNVEGNNAFYLDSVRLMAAYTGLQVGSNGTGGSAYPLLAQLPSRLFNADVYTTAYPFVANQWIALTFPGELNLAASSVISLPISIPTTSLTAAGTNPQFRFGFMATGESAITWSNVCLYSDDGGFLYCDCSTVASATRIHCVRFFVQILDNLPDVNPAEVFAFGTPTASGNLTIGDDYTYMVSEVQTVTGSYPTGDLIESEGSALSEVVTATYVDAQTTLKLAAQANDGTNGRGVADTFVIWRGGGVFTDGFWRYVASVPVGANATDTVNGYWTWDHTTRTFTDNTPDSALLLADLYEINRDYWPTGAIDPTNPGSGDPRGAISCLCVANGRLFGAAGNTIYASWLLSTDGEAGLYTSNATDPSDPSVTIKGGAFPLGSGLEADVVRALVPLSTAVVALRQDAISHLEGYDPTNFATVDRYRQAGIGCVAPRAAVADASGGALCYLSSVGVMEYNLDTPKPVGQEIEPLLGVGDGTTIAGGPTGFGRAVQVHHDRRRLLFTVQTATDAANSVAYVWDSRLSLGGDPTGYVRWMGLAVSSACTADGTLYLGGEDGQIYTLKSNSGDKATPVASEMAIAMALTTRAVGGEVHHPYGWGGNEIYPDAGTIPASAGARAGAQMIDVAGEKLRLEKRPCRVYFELSTAADSVPVTLGLTGSTDPNAGWEGTFTTRADGGETSDKMRVSSGIRGVHLTMSLSASVTRELRVRSLAVESYVGRRR